MKKTAFGLFTIISLIQISCMHDPPQQSIESLIQHKWTFDSVHIYTNPRNGNGFENLLNPPGSYYDFNVNNKLYQSGIYSFGKKNESGLDTANYIFKDYQTLYSYKVHNAIPSVTADSLMINYVDSKSLILIHSSGNPGNDAFLYFNR